MGNWGSIGPSRDGGCLVTKMRLSQLCSFSPTASCPSSSMWMRSMRDWLVAGHGAVISVSLRVQQRETEKGTVVVAAAPNLGIRVWRERRTNAGQGSCRLSTCRRCEGFD